MEKDASSLRTKRGLGCLSCRARLLRAYPYLLLATLATLFYFSKTYWTTSGFSATKLPPHAVTSLAHCHSLQEKPGPPPDFYKRSRSDRFEEGTRPVLIKNAKIWTGDRNGTEVLRTDVLLDKGIIKRVGRVGNFRLEVFKDDLVVIDAKDAWVTPG